jgi:hypothetical protein
MVTLQRAILVLKQFETLTLVNWQRHRRGLSWYRSGARPLRLSRAYVDPRRQAFFCRFLQRSGKRWALNGRRHCGERHRLVGRRKDVARGEGECLANAQPFQGYEMHVGRTRSPDCARPLLRFADERLDGATSADGRVVGAYLHGLFADDGQRADWMAAFGAASELEYETTVERTLDKLAHHRARRISIAKRCSPRRGRRTQRSLLLPVERIFGPKVFAKGCEWGPLGRVTGPDERYRKLRRPLRSLRRRRRAPTLRVPGWIVTLRRGDGWTRRVSTLRL